MSSINPYIKKIEIKQTDKNFKIIFQPLNKKIIVNSKKLLNDFDGVHGSILQIAHQSGIEIEHSCGGVCACSTCHVIIKSGLETCNEASDDEEDMLDLAPGLEPSSRLACQCVPDGSKDMVVEIPEWNRNKVSETK